MVPGQVIAADTIGFMRKLDVKEIHGYNNTRGLKLIKLAAIGKARPGSKPTAAPAAAPVKEPARKKQAAGE
jgi:arginine decarboxylase